MEILTLDLSAIHTKTELFDALTALPPFPSYFGKNFDALYDVLSTESFKLEIDGAYDCDGELINVIGTLRKVLEDAARTNPGFTFEFLERPSEEEE
ncbi:MAG: barstar family protein [Clostridiales bacterium]|nr:barstar family protein [Clostridiales bacterium]